jgi:hydroxymethylbilane synthase
LGNKTIPYLCARIEKYTHLEQNFRIGIPNNPWEKALKTAVTKAFEVHSWKPLFQSLPPEQLTTGLQRGELDIAARPLHLLPVEPPQGIAHAALIAREEPLTHLLIHPDSRDNGLFQLPQGARVSAAYPWQEVQLRDFRPDLQWEAWHGNLAQQVENIRSRRLDALVLTAPEAALAMELFPDLLSLTPDPREFCPAPGLGGVLLQTCADDLTTRRLLKAVHQVRLAEQTNVGRKLLRLLGGDLTLPLGAYCHRDPMDNLHVWAAFQAKPAEPLRRVRLSSSTTFELAEQVFTALQ